MNWKTWVPLGLAIVLGLVALKIARNIVAGRATGGVSEGSVRVVVANSDLPEGTQLTASVLRTGKIAGEINTDAVFTDASSLEGRVLIVPAAKGTPILASMLAPVGTGSGLQALIPPGMRAVTLEINEFSGVGGYLTPGCHVDVVATLGGEGGDSISRTIVQNVKVQAVGSRQQTQGGDSSSSIKSVTLIASPKDVEAIELAAATGRPRLVLRSSGDDSPVPSSGVTLGELRRSSARKDPFAVQPVIELFKSAPATQPVETWNRTRQIKIIRGGVETETTVEEIASPVGGRWMTGGGTEELPVNRQ